MDFLVSLTRDFAHIKSAMIQPMTLNPPRLFLDRRGWEVCAVVGMQRGAVGIRVIIVDVRVGTHTPGAQSSGGVVVQQAAQQIEKKLVVNRAV